MTIVQTIRLAMSAAEAMRRESQRRYPYETGGLLIGHIEADCLHVIHIVGPGPQARHGLRTFVRDGHYAQRELDTQYVASNGQLDYVGEWHSHPLPVGPSAQDRASLAWISVNEAYHQNHPVLMIYQCVRNKQWLFQGYQWQGTALIAVSTEIGAM